MRTYKHEEDGWEHFSSFRHMTGTSQRINERSSIPRKTERERESTATVHVMLPNQHAALKRNCPIIHPHVHTSAERRKRGTPNARPASSLRAGGKVNLPISFHPTSCTSSSASSSSFFLLPSNADAARGADTAPSFASASYPCTYIRTYIPHGMVDRPVKLQRALD
ncbi:hypothetical protein BKA80DRAFT_263887 [Phyllosticta citrichinensis]